MKVLILFISLIRALLRREGLRIPSGMARSFPRRLATLTVPEPLSAEIAPLLAVMETLNSAEIPVGAGARTA